MICKIFPCRCDGGRVAVAVVTGKTDIDKIRQEEEGEHKISIFSDFESEHKQESIQTLIIIC